jgi:outer membrane protein
MKKSILILISLLLAFSFTSNAQTEKGKVLLGTTVNLAGNIVNYISPQSNNIGVSFGTATTKYGEYESESKLTIFNFSPQVGYFFTDGLVGGATINFVNYTEKDKDSDEKYSNSIFKAGPFLRYYFDLEKVKPYLHLSTSFGNISYDDSDYKTNIMDIGGGVGLAVFFNDFVSFDVIAGYNYFKMTEENSDDPTYDVESTMGNIALDIGFTILIGSNKE